MMTRTAYNSLEVNEESADSGGFRSVMTTPKLVGVLIVIAMFCVGFLSGKQSIAASQQAAKFRAFTDVVPCTGEGVEGNDFDNPHICPEGGSAATCHFDGVYEILFEHCSWYSRVSKTVTCTEYRDYLAGYC
mmetsp:Transcript_8866/g.8949  ORF Transcript_8866/g.8949 Transcript_8866/m.8949 type:complete len:132 (+) Transcript_8866:76-471(+)|eukprot:CAMPEP_0182416872 /NCGR_PEP_ID=MMETSP1167-20130531/1252_1 /TAXON_ID=2988 /ORGANISM="Mallomonas Sp, Strain CCMP3275" /LENGTH=131 /DNA_ID=CAMNT_0024590005 /DNA_START=56 /DNA_END=454 /DNA_ORIENTATION=+